MRLVAGKWLLPLIAALCVAGNVCGQNYPSRPVRIILPAAAGGALDALSRIYGQKMSESWGQPVIVENRAGASGNIVHVPYKDVALAQTDLMAGRVQAYIAPLPAFLQFIRAGKMRPLGVTNTRRNPSLPDVPTLQEADVPGYEAVTWYGLYAPARTPRDRILRTHGALAKALQSPEVKERFAALSVDIIATTPEQLGKYLKEEVEKWGRVVKAMKLHNE